MQLLSRSTYIIHGKGRLRRITPQLSSLLLVPSSPFCGEPVVAAADCMHLAVHGLSSLYYVTSLVETAFAASIAGSSAHECAFHTCGKPKLFKTNHVRREFHVFGTKFTFYGIRGGGPYNHGKCQPMHTTF